MNQKEQKEQLGRIKLVATDCDGVLTDGGLYYTEHGDEVKRFHVLDGMGFFMLQECGIRTAIITSEDNEIVKKRAKKLKVDYLICGTKDKLSALKEICRTMGILLEEKAYIGDDVFDIPAIEASGFGCVPITANTNIKQCNCYITQKGGGMGVFREIADLILSSRKE